MILQMTTYRESQVLTYEPSALNIKIKSSKSSRLPVVRPPWAELPVRPSPPRPALRAELASRRCYIR